MPSEPPPPFAPVPINATWLPGVPNRVRVTFDQDLVADPALNFINWTAIKDGLRYLGNAASASGSVVTASVMFAGTAPVSDQVTFLPPPFDVIGLLNGLPAPQFIGFPMA